MASAGYPMHQTTVAKLENATRPTTIEELYALAAIFETPATALVRPEDAPDRAEVMAGIVRADAERRRIEAEIAAHHDVIEDLRQQLAEVKKQRARLSRKFNSQEASNGEH